MTTSAIVSAIISFLGLVLPYLKDWSEGKPQKEAEDAIQRMRKALAKGDGADVAAIAADQHDRVRLALQGKQNRGG